MKNIFFAGMTALLMTSSLAFAGDKKVNHKASTACTCTSCDCKDCQKDNCSCGNCDSKSSCGKGTAGSCCTKK